MKTINKLLLCIGVISLAACDDIIEKDITGDMVIPLYPMNDTEIESNVVNFQWNELDGADDYRIQVYSESNNMVLDSLVNETNFTYPLAPGHYQWRVRGENFAYTTAYTFSLGFSVIATDDLTNQQVQLTNPGAGIYTKETSLTFSWTTVPAAEHYVFQLINVSSGNTLVHEQGDITGTSYNLPGDIISQDAHYIWKVKAVNSENGTETPFQSRNFYFDTTAPNQPQNSLPDNEAEEPANTTIDFEWTVPLDPGPVASPLTYTIQIATDSSFTSVVHSATTTSASYEYTFSADDTYYWRVRATDQAGNEGDYGGYSEIVITD